MKKLRLCSGFLLVFAMISKQAFAGSIFISASSASAKASLKSELISEGVSPASFSDQVESDSIFISTAETKEKDIQVSKTGRFAKLWFILLEKHAVLTDLRQSLHEGLPDSRIFVSPTAASVAGHVKKILREQNRLNHGIAGLNTLEAPKENLDYSPEVGSQPYPVAPLGSAVATHSGALASTGIQTIIHTASGSMMRDGEGFDPTTESVQNSVINAVALAREGGHKRVALPIIGGSIFISRLNQGQGIKLQALVDLIVDVLVRESAGMKIIFTVRANNRTSEAECIRKSFERLGASDRERFELSDQSVWTIVKFQEHHATAIINSANMEITFGGGVSGEVARAVDGKVPSSPSGISNSTKIDQEGLSKILLFNQL